MSKQALIDALKAGPTAGPWVASWDGVTTLGDHHGNQVILSANVMNDQRLIDTHYIAAANPATIRAILADLERADGALERVQRILRSTPYHVDKDELFAVVDAALAQMAGGE